MGHWVGVVQFSVYGVKSTVVIPWPSLVILQGCLCATGLDSSNATVCSYCIYRSVSCGTNADRDVRGQLHLINDLDQRASHSLSAPHEARTRKHSSTELRGLRNKAIRISSNLL